MATSLLALNLSQSWNFTRPSFWPGWIHYVLLYYWEATKILACIGVRVRVRVRYICGPQPFWLGSPVGAGEWFLASSRKGHASTRSSICSGEGGSCASTRWPLLVWGELHLQAQDSCHSHKGRFMHAHVLPHHRMAQFRTGHSPVVAHPLGTPSVYYTFMLESQFGVMFRYQARSVRLYQYHFGNKAR